MHTSALEDGVNGHGLEFQPRGDGAAVQETLVRGEKSGRGVTEMGFAPINKSPEASSSHQSDGGSWNVYKNSKYKAQVSLCIAAWKCT